MKGSIEYFIKLRRICIENNGNCKNCPLGNEKNIMDCNCPRLIAPKELSDDKIVDLVRI